MTKIVNKDQPMTLFGEKTPRAVIYKSESHKLHPVSYTHLDVYKRQEMAH